MAWPSSPVWKLCALDLAAAAALAAVAFARIPHEQACTEPQASDTGPGFTTLAAPTAPPACLRFRLR